MRSLPDPSSLPVALSPGDPTYDVYPGTCSGHGRSYCSMHRQSAASRGLSGADAFDRLPDRGQADPRQTLRGLPLLLQFPLPAETERVRRPGPRRDEKGRLRRRAPAVHGPHPVVHRCPVHAGMAEEGILQRDRQHGCERSERLDHDPAAFPQDEEPRKHRRVPAGNGGPDLRGGPERSWRDT